MSTVVDHAHMLAQAAMPDGSPVEAWEDGYVAGWQDAMDMAIALVKDAIPDDACELQASAWADGFVAGHVAGKTGLPPEQWKPNPYHTPPAPMRPVS